MKKICVAILSLIIIAVAAITAGCGTKTDVGINWRDDLPTIVYNKFDRHEHYKDLYVYKIGGETQKIAGHTGPNLSIGNDNSLLGYSYGSDIVTENGNFTENDVYIVDRDGRQQLLDSGVAYYEIAESSGKIFYSLDDQPDTMLVKEYIDGQLVDQDSISGCVSWVINIDASTIVIIKQRSADDSAEKIKDMYFFEDGTLRLIAEDTAYPDNQHVSGNGNVLFITKNEQDATEGMLFIKRDGEEPVLIAQNSGASAEISEDGTVIMFATYGEKEKLHCMYNGKEIELPDDSGGGILSRTSNTMVFLSSVDGQRKLYKVTEGGEPQEIDDAEVIMGISADGSCVAYLSDLNSYKNAGDLYVARDGHEPELMDKNVSYNSVIARLGIKDVMLQMNDDGSVIAYCKKYYSNSPTADLYVKQIGEEPIFVDERVALGFMLF